MKPELTGEDAVVRGVPELMGDEIGMEMDTTLAEQRVRHELYTYDGISMPLRF